MKATQWTTYRSMQLQLGTMGDRLHELRTLAATGKKVSRPSDDPSSVRPILDVRAQVRLADRYLETMGTGLDRAKVVEGHMSSMENALVRAKELALSAVNGGYDPQSMATVADQIANIRAQLVDTANARFDGKYVFAGYEEQTKPFTVNPTYNPATYNPANPATYPVLYNVGLANSQPNMLEISPGETVQVGLTGNSLFLGDADNDGVTDPGAYDIFAVLTQIEEAIRADDKTAISAKLDTIDGAADQARRLRSKIGNNAARLESAMQQMEITKIDLKETLSRYEDADLIETLTDLTQQETAFEAALNITAKISELSILKFI